MIYTFTINPSLDYIVHVNQLELGQTNRTTNEEIKVGGKGINTSIVLNNLGVKSIATGVTGGFTGDYLQQVLANDYPEITCSFINSQKMTRINIKLKGDQETEINGRGEKIDKQLTARLLEKMQEIPSKSIVSLAGSIEQADDENLYRDLAALLVEKQIEFVIDNSSTKLLEVLPYQPLLVKPNRDELAIILNRQLETEGDLIAGGKELLRLGAKNVIISLGGEGAIFLNENSIYQAEPAKGQLVNSVGAGDSMIAGFLFAYQQGLEAKICFQYAVATGTATAYSNYLADKQTVLEIYQQTKVQGG